jgi:hypothetical protein
MPSISGRHNRIQIIFDVALVGVSMQSEHYPDETTTAFSVFSESVKALVDTGATATSVSPQVAQRLNLRPAGKRDVMTANGLKRARYYEFQVALLGSTQSGAAPPFFVLPNAIKGNELNADGMAFDILLGMDVISQGDLIIRRDGSFTFEF